MKIWHKFKTLFLIWIIGLISPVVIFAGESVKKSSGVSDSNYQIEYEDVVIGDGNIIVKNQFYVSVFDPSKTPEDEDYDEISIVIERFSGEKIGPEITLSESLKTSILKVAKKARSVLNAPNKKKFAEATRSYKKEVKQVNKKLSKEGYKIIVDPYTYDGSILRR